MNMSMTAFRVNLTKLSVYPTVKMLNLNHVQTSRKVSNTDVFFDSSGMKVIFVLAEHTGRDQDWGGTSSS